MAKRVAIIGGGVIGLCSAWYLRRSGFDVTVIDRNPAERDGCSFGNSGLIVPSHFIPLAAPGMVALGLKWMWNPESPFYIKPRLSWDLLTWAWQFWRSASAAHVERSAPLLRDLHMASRAEYEHLADELGHSFGLEQRGLLMLCKSQHALDEEAATANKAVQLGIPAEALDADKTAALDPDVRMDVAGSVYFPNDCHLSPREFMAALERRLIAAGVEFRWLQEVIDWKSERRRLVAATTRNDDVAADEFVIAGGSWSPTLAKQLGLKLPMQAGKGYSVTLTKPRQLPRLSAIFTEARIAVTPMNGSLRFGGTMEISGTNDRIEPRRVQGIIKAIPSYYPEFQATDFADVKPWHGLRPCSPDGLPYLGRIGGFDNLTIATGHAMMGMSLGPITGKIVAEMIAGEKPRPGMSLLVPDRFAVRRQGMIE